MENYVTFEQAVKLKEFGFDWRCNHYYQDNNQSLHPNFYRDFNKHDKLYTDDEELKKVTLSSAPTLSQAQKWLREVKNIVVLVTCNLDYEKGHEWYWFVDKDFDIEDPEHKYSTYEQALSAGIDKTLELLKQPDMENRFTYFENV